ncbi:MAG: DUF11 domain-containing protein, partial [Methanomassiliicoccales archaeon]|nr:DUF11 domain-containing protein [Methanomassiliicoccales archaeon]
MTASKSLIAALIVFVMVGSSFLTMAASADNVPIVWTDKDMYLVGERVAINGENFAPGGDPVLITLSHPDLLGPVEYREVVNADGTFLCDDYVAGSGDLLNPDIPIVVVATQNTPSGVLEASCIFYDPSIVVEAYQPFDLHQYWGKDNTKGWNEGDSVPMRVLLSTDAASLNVTIAVDWFDNHDAHGFDYLTKNGTWIWDPTATNNGEYIPQPPFNIIPQAETPTFKAFYVLPNEGVITWQGYLGPGTDTGRATHVYGFKITLLGPVDTHGDRNATIRFGAHLSLTAGTFKGAAFFEGSSLHVKVVQTVPSIPGSSGSRDVPFPVNQILTPPSMHISKSCSPDLVALGGVVTNTIDFWNTGQADAVSVVLVDDMPAVLTYLSGTAMIWTTDNPSWIPFRNPDSTNPTLNSITWNIGTVRGTGKNPDGTPAQPVFHMIIKFDAQVSLSAVAKTYVNWANLTYTDALSGVYPPVTSWCDFDVVVVTFEKFADRTCAAVGEVIDYWFVIRNPSSVTLTFELWDPLFKPYDPDDPLWSGILPPKSVVIVDSGDVPALAHTVTSSDIDHLINVATVVVTGGSEISFTLQASWEVDILHPQLTIHKWSEVKCAAEGDVITYWIEVTNPSTDTEMWF